jgi:DNA-directed RNA polymerase specialized sigma24 family protein
MESPDSKPHGYFPTTIWSEIARLRQADSEAARIALDSLLAKYGPPLKACLVRQFRVDEDQAADWFQSFVWKKVLLKNLFTSADRNRGKFRTFLVNTLQNFVRDEIEHAARQRRSPSGGLVSLEDEEVVKQEPPDNRDDPSHALDVAWARGVVAETLRQMQAECEGKGNQRIWEVFRLRLLEPQLEGAEPIPYKELFNRLGFQSDAEAGNALITAKRMFTRLLRSVIAEYARTEQDIDAEINELRRILGGPG